MKSNAKSSLYFSAYPLKAINPTPSEGSSSSQSPYLRSILSGKTKTSSRVRVFPMANPYTKKITAPKKMVNRAKDVQGSGEEWYNNYE